MDDQDSMPPVTQLPVNVDLDLDSYAKPADQEIPDFTVRLGGRVVTFTNPDEIDWQDLLDITDPVQFIRYSCTKEDREHIVSLRLPGFKMSKLMEAYQTHFQIEDKMDRARRAERFNR